MPFSGVLHIHNQQDNHLESVTEWMLGDEMRMEALRIASKLMLKDWCLAAGFVRTLIWDKLHGYDQLTTLGDIDLIYFDPVHCSERIDQQTEDHLKQISNYPWSVKNQARMHLRNNDMPYSSSIDAMTYWVELQAAIGAKLSDNGDIIILAPFGLNVFFDNSIRLNKKRPKSTAFKNRIQEKQWLEKWPKLRVVD